MNFIDNYYNEIEQITNAYECEKVLKIKDGVSAEDLYNMLVKIRDDWEFITNPDLV